MADSMQVMKGETVTDEAIIMQTQNGTKVTMRNDTKASMTLGRFVNWSGNPEGGSFPASIASGGSVQFNHLKGPQLGSMGAVQYNGRSVAGETCAWILSWDAPPNTSSATPNRVFGLCGLKEHIDAVSWDEIRRSLSVGLPRISYENHITKTRGTAEIGGGTPNMATLISSFGLMN